MVTRVTEKLFMCQMFMCLFWPPKKAGEREGPERGGRGVRRRAEAGGECKEEGPQGGWKQVGAKGGKEEGPKERK